jgi:TonB family protein
MRSFARLILLLGFIALTVFLFHALEQPPANPASTEKAEANEPAFSICRGDTIYYGAFSSNVGVAILDVGSTPFLGSEFGGVERSDGKFIIVTVAISNQQRDAITMDTNLFEIVDSNGIVYSASEKSIELGSSDLFLARINPGVNKVGRIAFDVPENLKLDNLELRFRGGMTGAAAIVPLRINSVVKQSPARPQPAVQTDENSRPVQSRTSDPSTAGASIEHGVSAEVGGQAGSGLYHVGGSVSAPVPLNTVEAEFTDQARRAKFQGVCFVSVIVDANGDPQNPQVIHPLGMGLDEKAVEAVRKYKFRPAVVDGGQPVPVKITVQVNFRLY